MLSAKRALSKLPSLFLHAHTKQWMVPTLPHVRQICSTKPLLAIEYHKSQAKVGDDGKAPIAVLFGWLLAKSRHLEKYGNIYRCHGADVITCKLEAIEVLRPTVAEAVAVRVLEMLQRPENAGRPIIIHGFSVGGYMYSQILNKLVTEQKYAEVKGRIKGQIFDSPVDFEGIPHGVSAASFNNNLARMSLKFAIQTYLNLTEKYTTKVYRQRSELFYHNPVAAPSLLLYSRDDPVANSETIDSLAAVWKGRGMDVKQKPWEESPHVSHMYAHTDEYIQEILDFLEKLGVFESVLDRDTVKTNM